MIVLVGTALITPHRASALDAYSAANFRSSIGVNTTFGQPGVYMQKPEQVKQALIELGALNIRERVGKLVTPQARDLWNCCGIKTLARIDARFDNKRETKVNSSLIGSEIDKALTIGANAIAGFEGPNEYSHYQNTGNWYLDLRNYMAGIHNTVRSVEKLSTPIIGPTVFMRQVSDIRQIGNISNSIDASNLHMYIGGNAPSYRLDEYMGDVQIMAPGEPVWVTEFGYHNGMTSKLGGMPISEAGAATYLPRWIALMFSKSPRGKFFIYELMDEGTNTSDHEQMRGLVRYNFSRKPAFHTVRRLIATARGATPGLQPQPLDISFGGQTNNLRKVLLQKSSKQYLLMLWQEVESWDVKKRAMINNPDQRVTVSLPRTANFTVIDTQPYADASVDAPPARIATSAKQATVSVPDHVVVVQLDLN